MLNKAIRDTGFVIILLCHSQDIALSPCLLPHVHRMAAASPSYNSIIQEEGGKGAKCQRAKGIPAKFILILIKKGKDFLAVALSKFVLICRWPYLGLINYLVLDFYKEQRGCRR